MQPFRPNNNQQQILQQQQLQQQILQQQQVMRGQQQHQELVRRRQRRRRAEREVDQPPASAGRTARPRYEAPPAADTSLAVLAGPAAGTTFHVRSQLRLGRVETDEGGLGGDATLSRHHAVLHRTADGELLIEDLGSTNGTWVNGERITGQRRLSAGDRVQLGETTLLVPGAAGVRRLSRHDAGPARSWQAGSGSRPGTGRAAAWLGGGAVVVWVLVAASHAEWVRLHDGPIRPVSYWIAVVITVVIAAIIAVRYRRAGLVQRAQHGEAEPGFPSSGSGQPVSPDAWPQDPVVRAGDLPPAADSSGPPAVRYDSRLADGSLRFYAPEDPDDPDCHSQP